METVIITGATSFIGIHLVNRLLTLNKKVYAVVRPNSLNMYRLDKYLGYANLILITLDMKEISRLSEFIDDTVDCFYHLAWEGARFPYRDDQTIQLENFKQTLESFNVAKYLGIKKFIVSGSQSEYGKVNGKINENHKCKPETEYGKYKLASYNTLSKLVDKDNICLIWTRIFSVYGIYDSPDTLVMSCIKKMGMNQVVNLTECKQKWDFLNVDDLTNALVKFGEKDCNSGIYNLASGESKPLYKYVEIIKKVLGSTSELAFGNIAYKSDGPVHLEPIVSKIENELDWIAEKKFEQGILEIAEQLNIDCSKY